MIVAHGEFFSEEIIQSEKKDGNWNQNGKDALCKLSDGTTGLGDSGNDVWCAGSYRRWSWADNRLHHRDESPETERLIFTNKKRSDLRRLLLFCYLGLENRYVFGMSPPSLTSISPYCPLRLLSVRLPLPAISFQASYPLFYVCNHP